MSTVQIRVVQENQLPHPGGLIDIPPEILLTSTERVIRKYRLVGKEFMATRTRSGSTFEYAIILPTTEDTFYLPEWAVAEI